MKLTLIFSQISFQSNYDPKSSLNRIILTVTGHSRSSSMLIYVWPLTCPPILPTCRHPQTISTPDHNFQEALFLSHGHIRSPFFRLSLLIVDAMVLSYGHLMLIRKYHKLSEIIHTSPKFIQTPRHSLLTADCLTRQLLVCPRLPQI